MTNGFLSFCAQYYLEPPVKLREALEKQSLSNDSFVTFQHGEARLVYADGSSTRERTKNWFNNTTK